MAAVAERLAQKVADSERETERLRDLLEKVKKFGEDDLAALVNLYVVEVSSSGNGQADEDPPRGREAIRRIVSDRPGIWTLAELRAEMLQRGWFTTPKAVEVATKRLCDINCEGKRIGKGRYLFP